MESQDPLSQWGILEWIVLEGILKDHLVSILLSLAKTRGISFRREKKKETTKIFNFQNSFRFTYTFSNSASATTTCLLWENTTIPINGNGLPKTQGQPGASTASPWLSCQNSKLPVGKYKNWIFWEAWENGW